MPQTEVEGLRILYERAGIGPLLVLAHGFVGDGRSTWQRQIDDLWITVVGWMVRAPVGRRIRACEFALVRPVGFLA